MRCMSKMGKAVALLVAMAFVAVGCGGVVGAGPARRDPYRTLTSKALT